MQLQQRIKAFVQLGKSLELLSKEQTWPGYTCGLSEDEYKLLVSYMEQVRHRNAWFDKQNVAHAFDGLAKLLDGNNLKQWLDRYDQEKLDDAPKKTVALIMAGNIPLVGFHDLLTTLLSGNKALVKFSSDDNYLFPAVLEALFTIDDGFRDLITISEGKLEGFDAVIATGSNNSSRYFKQYFEAYPHVIRKNRTSVAVLNGEETDEDLSRLADDIFTFYGLGCRNVSKVIIPENFDLDRLFRAFFRFKEVVNHQKYANNYDYQKAIYLMNGDDLLENGFILLKETKELHSPLAVLFYQRYKALEEVTQFLNGHSDQIQCVVGKGYIPFGKAQSPDAWDYADGVDTMDFLHNLK